MEVIHLILQMKINFQNFAIEPTKYGYDKLIENIELNPDLKKYNSYQALFLVKMRCKPSL